MLQATFQRLVHGVNAEKESKLWRQGILSWDDLEKEWSPQQELFRGSDVALGRSPFSILRHALNTQDVSFFANLLDPREYFRIALAFPHRTMFLDIETTGLSRFYDYVTLVGWCYQGRYNALIRGDDDRELRRALREAKVVVTYNGSLFDLPFLRDKFSDLSIPKVHVDLRFLGKRVGLTGGQKAIEDELGFKRPTKIKEVKGEEAPLLWHRYRRGSLDSLKLLIEYNHCDIEGMKVIFDHVVKRLTKDRAVPVAIRKQIPNLAVPAEIQWSTDKVKAKTLTNEISLRPYSGSTKPATTLDEISRACGNKPIRVVGVDLTGSEARPSGWCLLDGSEAVTHMIGTDADLMKATLAARPDIVSIDSPLSLPKGRISVFDDDPGRQEFGIMRSSERILKRRGINVYPALIPSMQKLTARGIKLASQFRKLGLPVIESYPGAAQDIMGIPRKRASLDMLRDGLAEFGVRGAYTTNQVTHDELDAITSAVVALFFWGGKFESLGSEDEEALIIPDLHVDPQNWLGRRVVGLSGPIAAGKTTAARIFESMGYFYIRYSMVLESIMNAEGVKASRKKLQNFGDQVHREFGQRWLGRKLVASLPAKGNIVIDGLRFPDDRAFLLETFGQAFRHFHIEAPEDIRRARFLLRENNDALFTRAQSHPVEQQIVALRPLAQTIVANESSVEMLNENLVRASRLDLNEV